MATQIQYACGERDRTATATCWRSTRETTHRCMKPDHGPDETHECSCGFTWGGGDNG